MSGFVCATIVIASDLYWSYAFARLFEAILGIVSAWFLSQLLITAGLWSAYTRRQNVIPFVAHIRKTPDLSRKRAAPN